MRITTYIDVIKKHKLEASPPPEKEVEELPTEFKVEVRSSSKMSLRSGQPHGNVAPPHSEYISPIKEMHPIFRQTQRNYLGLKNNMN